MFCVGAGASPSRRWSTGATGRSRRSLLIGSARSPSLIFAPRGGGSGSPAASSMPAHAARADAAARDPSYGFAAILLSVRGRLGDRHRSAYFVGRAIGGPKLWPRDQPEQDLVGRDRRHASARMVGGVGGRASRSASSNSPPLRSLALAAVGRGAGRRSAGIRDQAPVRRQGREPAHSRPWRPDGPARRLLGGGAGRAV